MGQSRIIWSHRSWVPSCRAWRPQVQAQPVESVRAQERQGTIWCWNQFVWSKPRPCCMCAAEGEVTRAVQLILRQGQICNTENWHLHWDLEIEKDGNITLISKQLLLLCCFPSGRAKAPQLGRTLPALCWLVCSVHFSALFSELTKILPTVAIKPRLRFWIFTL